MHNVCAFLFHLPSHLAFGADLRRVSYLSAEIIKYLSQAQLFISSDAPSFCDNLGHISTLGHETACKNLEKFSIVSAIEDVKFFSGLQKPAFQKWVLFLHSWQLLKSNFITDDLLDKIDAVAVVSEAHKTECLLNNWPLEKIVVIKNSIAPLTTSAPATLRKQRAVLWLADTMDYDQFSAIAHTLQLFKRDLEGYEISFYFSLEVPSWLKTSSQFDSSIMRAVAGSTIPDKSVLYLENSIIVSYSSKYAQILEVIEAQQFGCIPVITRTCDCFSVMLPLVGGLLCEPDDIQLIFHAITTSIKLLESNSSPRKVVSDFVEKSFAGFFSATGFLRLLV